MDPEAQLIASILAKKLAVKAKGILLDIPYGDSAKVKSIADAKKLGNKFEKIAKILKLNLKVALTDGSEPIGNGIGPVLEMRDVLSILQREKTRPLDLENKSLKLSAIILEMSGKAKKGRGMKIASEILNSGKALQKFKQIIEAQNGSLDKKVLEKKLSLAMLNCTIVAQSDGKIKLIDNKKIASVAKAAGCPSDKFAGVYLHVHVGDKVSKGQKLITIYSGTLDKLSFAKELDKRLIPIIIG